MQKVLLIAYYWPPAGGAGVQRWLKFVKYLSAKNFEWHVYTAANPEVPAYDDSLTKEVPLGVKVIRKHIWEPFEFYRRFTGKKDQSSSAFLSEEAISKQSFSEKIALWVRANCFLPDAKRFWIGPSVRFLKKYMQEHNITTLVSTGPPHTVHMIAYRLKRDLDIKWLADFRDPWTQIDYMHQLPMLSMVKQWHRQWEQKVAQSADTLVVVSPRMQTYFAQMLPLTMDKIALITNGYDTDIAHQTSLDKDFTILHSGSINADRTHPAFFKAIRLALDAEPNLQQHLRLLWIGKLSFEARQLLKTYGLESYSDFKGYLPYAHLAPLLAKARLLYLPVNNTPDAKTILTGKVFEYLPAQRPILAQAPTDGDLADLFKTTAAGSLFDYDNEEGIKYFILERYTVYEEGEDRWQNENIEQYSRQALSTRMSAYLHKLNTPL